MDKQNRQTRFNTLLWIDRQTLYKDICIDRWNRFYTGLQIDMPVFFITSFTQIGRVLFDNKIYKVYRSRLGLQMGQKTILALVFPQTESERERETAIETVRETEGYIEIHRDKNRYRRIHRETEGYIEVQRDIERNRDEIVIYIQGERE